MTSMEFFQPAAHNTDEPPEWGTGKLKDPESLWIPKRPTWQYSGKPAEQYYTLTQLKRSNVRTNDQLLPEAKDIIMGDIMINKPFPAEHPYSSHIPRFAVFPKFDSPEDQKKGVNARSEMPKNAEMPSQPYNVTIVHKSKGCGDRREIQALPPESEKRPLVWHEKNFDQLVKSPSSGQQSYYPTPPKVFHPNLALRDDSTCIHGNMKVSERTANANRNVEREQWQTTYDLSHTGLGPSNALALDNLAEKRRAKAVTGTDDDKLYPRGVNTFDPPRPMEGRIARLNTPRPPLQTEYSTPEADPDYKRKMTLTELEEDRLWNGKEYLNLPDAAGDEQGRRLDAAQHPDVGLDNLTAARPSSPGWSQSPSNDSSGKTMTDARHGQIQQIEASNRWKTLELHTPSHDLTSLQHKSNLVSDKTKPSVFYDHEGAYQRERAGLYKTSYDPYSLQWSMNKDERATARIFDKSDCHEDALNLPVSLNQDMANAMRYGRTLGGPPGSVPQLNSQPSQYEAFGPYDRERSLQQGHLQPNLETADIKTQENGIILKESTYGDSYNTRKFLQENLLSLEDRKEPLNLMSHENKDLNQVRAAAKARSSPGKSVQFNEDVMVASGAGAEPLRLSSAFIENPKAERPYTSPLTARPSHSVKVASLSATPRPHIMIADSKPTLAQMSLPVDVPKHRITSRHMLNDPGVDAFASLASNVQPRTRHSWAVGSAYQSQFAGGLDMSYKEDDPRFHWRYGSGVPRPQSTLLRIQDSFTKSDTRRRFHQDFPEINPDLRENHIRGKKHAFGGMNAQVLRGTPVVA